MDVDDSEMLEQAVNLRLEHGAQGIGVVKFDGDEIDAVGERRQFRYDAIFIALDADLD